MSRFPTRTNKGARPLTSWSKTRTPISPRMDLPVPLCGPWALSPRLTQLRANSLSTWRSTVLCELACSRRVLLTLLIVDDVMRSKFASDSKRLAPEGRYYTGGYQDNTLAPWDARAFGGTVS